MATTFADLTAVVRRRPSGGTPHRNLTLDHAQDLTLFRGPWRKLGLLLLVLAYLGAPAYLASSTLLTLTLCGVYAVGAIGLNLLTGYAGQVSLRSEEHTSELQSLMRISYAVFCLKKKKYNQHKNTNTTQANT